MSRFLNWLLTDMGKHFSAGFAVVSSSLLYCGNIIPHTYGMYKYKEIVQMYEGGEVKLVNEELLKRAYTVVKEADIHAKYKDPTIISFFHVPMFETFQAGATSLNYGAIIGIPINFKYRNVKDVDTQNLALYQDQPVRWGTDQGIAFKETLLLSEAAQKAAIAREVYAADSSKTLIRSLLVTVNTAFPFVAGRAVNMRLKFYQRPRSLRIAMYSVFTLTAVLMYCSVADSMTIFYEKSYDKKVAKLGKAYILGSIELYEKLLTRNQILREMLGDVGKSRYTLYGNKNSWLRTKSIPYTQRLDFFKAELKKWEEVKPDIE